MRKIFGYVHIPQQHAELMDAFNRTYLKPGITFKDLEDIATKQSDLDAWEQLQKVRTKLFDIIFGQTPKVA